MRIQRELSFCGVPKATFLQVVDVLRAAHTPWAHSLVNPSFPLPLARLSLPADVGYVPLERNNRIHLSLVLFPARPFPLSCCCCCMPHSSMPRRCFLPSESDDEVVVSGAFVRSGLARSQPKGQYPRESAYIVVFLSSFQLLEKHSTGC